MMRCPGCGSENPEGIKFCGKCATPLPRRCPQCGFENPAGFEFCGQCATSLLGDHARGSPALASPSLAPRAYTPRHLAEKILTTRAALEGERKHVTVLFADVKGSMELAEQVDPEEWHGIMDRH